MQKLIPFSLKGCGYIEDLELNDRMAQLRIAGGTGWSTPICKSNHLGLSDIATPERKNSATESSMPGHGWCDGLVCCGF